MDSNDKAMLDAINAAKAEEQQEVQQEVVEQIAEEQPQEVQEEQQQEEAAETEERTQEDEQIVTEEEEEEDVLIFDEQEDSPAENKPTFTAEVAEKLKAEVGIEVTSQEQLVATIKQLKEKAEKVETIFASEDIKAANEIAKQGGNWQEYLQVSSTDWDAIADEQLVMWQLETELGNKDEALQAYEEMSELMRKREAKRLRNEQKLIQSEQKAQIQDKARKQQEQYVKGIEAALSELNEVGKVRINDSDKERLKKLVLTYDEKLRANEMQKKYFLNDKGEVDFKKMMQSIAKLENYDRVVAVAMKQGKNIGKRETIEKVSNLTNPRQNQTVQDVTNRKPLTAYESFLERIKSGQPV